mmetsp:Transcript_20848/g.48976  ORF Transcript_20848/g.48976 Transcript_20848/m.48976 type:complete len:219 (+) Transcript_20848:445-1101(+)
MGSPLPATEEEEASPRIFRTRTTSGITKFELKLPSELDSAVPDSTVETRSYPKTTSPTLRRWPRCVTHRNVSSVTPKSLSRATSTSARANLAAPAPPPSFPDRAPPSQSSTSRTTNLASRFGDRNRRYDLSSPPLQYASECMSANRVETSASRAGLASTRCTTDETRRTRQSRPESPPTPLAFRSTTMRSSLHSGTMSQFNVCLMLAVLFFESADTRL